MSTWIGRRYEAVKEAADSISLRGTFNRAVDGAVATFDAAADIGDGIRHTVTEKIDQAGAFVKDTQKLAGAYDNLTDQAGRFGLADEKPAGFYAALANVAVDQTQTKITTIASEIKEDPGRMAEMAGAGLSKGAYSFVGGTADMATEGSAFLGKIAYGRILPSALNTAGHVLGLDGRYEEDGINLSSYGRLLASNQENVNTVMDMGAEAMRVGEDLDNWQEVAMQSGYGIDTEARTDAEAIVKGGAAGLAEAGGWAAGAYAPGAIMGGVRGLRGGLALTEGAEGASALRAAFDGASTGVKTAVKTASKHYGAFAAALDGTGVVTDPLSEMGELETRRAVEEMVLAMQAENEHLYKELVAQYGKGPTDEYLTAQGIDMGQNNVDQSVMTVAPAPGVSVGDLYASVLKDMGIAPVVLASIGPASHDKGAAAPAFAPAA